MNSVFILIVFLPLIGSLVAGFLGTEAFRRISIDGTPDGHDAPGARLSIASRRPGVNTNVLTDGSIVDPLSGNGQLNAIPVEVTRA